MKLELTSDDKWIVDWMKECLCRPRRASRICFDVIELSTGRIVRLRGEIMAYMLPVDKKVTLSIAPVDAYGNPARIDGVPIWATSDTAVVELQDIAADGLSCVAWPVGPLANAQISVSADADLGDGVKTITGLLDITTIAGEAAGVTIIAGAPEPK